MNCSPTLTAEEFKVLHNCLWELDSLGDPRVQNIVERIRKNALGNAYILDNSEFERKYEYYRNFQYENKLNTIWSVYELPVHGFLKMHPWAGATQIAYRDHWGDTPVFEPIQGPTWADLYRAADAAIVRSGDQHHIFIEHFSPNLDHPRQLLLTTGS